MGFCIREGNVAKVLKVYEDRFRERTRGSFELWIRYRKVSPGGVSYAIRFTKPYPIFIMKARGLELVDVDGNTYIDFWMGHGSEILGHNPGFIIEEVFDKIREFGSTHLGFEHPLIVEYAEFLTKTVPGLEMVRFTNSGTEAVMYAIRLARAYTGRRFVVKMEGGWHGGYDTVHVGVHPPFNNVESAGLPQEAVKYTLVAPFNDAEALEHILRKHDVACVIVEPVQGAGGCIEAEPNYLRSLRELCDRYGSLLVFDEVFTGFRIAFGGAQEYYGVKADLVILGKIIGGGFPGAGAFGGRSDIMDLIDHVKHVDPGKRSFHGGTFVGNVVTISAGYATLRFLSEHRELYVKSNRIWNGFRREIDKLCSDYGNICWTTGVGTMVGLHFTDKKPRSAREAYARRWCSGIEDALNIYSRVNGVLYLTEKMPHFLPSLLHSENEMRRLMEVIYGFLDEIISSNV